MAFQQISSLRKNRVYAPMILALAILLAIFVVRPVMSEYNDANATLNTLRSEIQEKEATLDRFLQMESELSQEGQTSLMGQIHKINRPFQAADILEAVMINEYTQSLISWGARIFVSAVSLDPGGKLPSGISRGTVSMTISARNTDEIVNYLTYLTKESPIAFILDDVNLPIHTADSSQETLSLPLVLGVYYFE